MSKKLITLTILFILLVMSACSNTSTTGDKSEGTESDNASNATVENEEINLRFMAAPQSGAWYPIAVGITEMMKQNMSNLKQVSIEPGGGVANVVGVSNGQAQLGFSQAAPASDGYNGLAPFDKKQEDIQYILSLFPHMSHIVVLKDSGIKSIEDIKGKRINVGTKGLLTEDVARRILDIHGMSYDDMKSVQNLSFADAVEQMKDGRLDAMFWTVPIPFAVLTDLSQSKEMELLSLPDGTINELTEQNTGFKKATIKAGTYKGVDHDVSTIQSPLVLLANKNAPDQLVYETTKTVVEGLEELGNIDPSIKLLLKENLVNDIGIPMHPAAEKYFKEAGLLK